MLVAVCLSKDAVFALVFCFDAYPMLRQTAKHILALADVDKVVIDADAVDPWVFIFL